MADFLDPADPNSETWAAFERDLRALGRSERTIQSYGESAQQLADHAKDSDLLELSKADVTAYLTGVRAMHSPATQLVRYRSLARFYSWAVAEEYLDVSPMARIRPPKGEEKLIPVPARDDLKALLAACEGTSFDAVRDAAIIRLMAECGLRLSECAGLHRDGDLDMVTGVVTVRGGAASGARWPSGSRPARR